MQKRAPYRLTSPCKSCPFRSDVQPYLRPERVDEIERGLDRGEFPCHATLDYERDGKGRETPETAHCAGALILLEKLNRPSQMMRICERIGLYDRRKLNMDAPVVESFAQMKERPVAKGKEKTKAKEKEKVVVSWGTGADVGPRDCILCGHATKRRVQNHAACERCSRAVKRALSSASRSVKSRDGRAWAITTHSGWTPGGGVAMGSIGVEVVQARTVGPRVEVTVVQGDSPYGKALGFNLLRAAGARALGEALIAAAKHAEAIENAEKLAAEPPDAERVPAREVAVCGRCKFRPAMAVVAGEEVCEKCRADAVIDAERRTA